MSKKASFFIALVFVFSTSSTVFAHHKTQVLGEATVASELVFPPVTSGPGLILPDSPFYFADKWFQNIKLFFAFSPEKKAQIRAQVAGERLAELRIMMSRNNQEGINTALAELTKEVKHSAQDIKEAAASGKKVDVISQQINDTVKAQKSIIKELEDQANGSLKAQLKSARISLQESKLEVEDELPEDTLNNEIEDNLNEEIDDHIEEASSSARGLEHSIDVLEKLASDAAEKQQVRREEALRHAIEVKNDTLKKQQEKLIEEEKKKQAELLKAQFNAAKQAREAIKRSQEATERFNKMRETVSEIQKSSINPTPTPTQTPTSSSGSSGSSSGSSGSSGSGDSGSGGSNDGGRSGSDH